MTDEITASGSIEQPASDPIEQPASDPIEPMDAFFEARLEMYDEHMLREVEGLSEAYALFATLVPPDAETLLDLGCGTGLELEFIYPLCPDIEVTGIDLTQAMLDRLAEKFPNKPITLICSSYIGYDFGVERYDVVISFETLHHLTAADKLGVYQQVFKALKPGGKYIEADYIVSTQEEEDLWFAWNSRLRAEQGVGAEELYHYDTPLCLANQLKLLEQAGFVGIEEVWRVGDTSILVMEKPCPVNASAMMMPPRTPDDLEARQNTA